MKRLFQLIACLCVLATPSFAQVGGQGTPLRSGPTNPATCDPTQGQLFFNNSTTPGKLKYCSATNTWSDAGNATMDSISQGIQFIKTADSSGPAPTVFNGDFEVPFPGTLNPSILPPPNWSPNPNMTCTYETVAPYEGSRSLKCVSNNSGSGASVIQDNEFFPVVPGETYYIRAAAKSDGIVSANVEIRFADSTGTGLTGSIGAPDIVASTSSTSWTIISASGVVPANAVVAFIVLVSGPFGVVGTTWYDTISAYRTSFPAGYVDQAEIAAPSNPQAGYERWYGNNSTHQFSCLTSAGGNCSPGGAGSNNFSALLPGTLSTAGSFIATGNTWDFSGATLFKGRVGAACTTTIIGDWCTDSTNNNILDYVNGAQVYRGVFPSLPANGSVVFAHISGSRLWLDGVAPVGGSFGGGQFPLVCTFTNPATGDVVSINASGICVNSTLGIPPQTVTTTPVAILSAWRGNILVLDSGAVNLTIAAAGSAGFASNFQVPIWNRAAAGVVTLTPTTSTISGGSTNVNAAASAVINPGDFCQLTSGANYLLACNSKSGPTLFTGTATLGTSAIASAACAAVVTVSASGVATTDVITVGFNGDPTAVTGYIPATAGMLTIIPYPTANNVNFKVCNNTSASVTPGAVTLNWKVVR